MGTKDEVVSTLRQLKRSHKKIRDEFALMDDSLIEELLGEQYTPQLHEQMKRHGDGQRLCSYPRSIRRLESVNAIVLFSMTSPRLGDKSIFNRSTPLHEIHHWRTSKPISPVLHSHRRHFMAWQQKVGVHGVDDSHALRNYKLLVSRNNRVESLLDKEKEAGIRFVLTLERWAGENGKLVIVVTNSIRKNFEEPIVTLNRLSLDRNSHVKRIETGLRSWNKKIMRKIGDVLTEDDLPTDS